MGQPLLAEGPGKENGWAKSHSICPRPWGWPVLFLVLIFPANLDVTSKTNVFPTVNNLPCSLQPLFSLVMCELCPPESALGTALWEKHDRVL